MSHFQARNKPIEPPKKPEMAPFFLPSVPSLSGEILFKATEKANEGTTGTLTGGDGKANGKKSISSSLFLQLLESSAETKNCESRNLGFLMQPLANV